MSKKLIFIPYLFTLLPIQAFAAGLQCEAPINIGLFTPQFDEQIISMPNEADLQTILTIWNERAAEREVEEERKNIEEPISNAPRPDATDDAIKENINDTERAQIKDRIDSSAGSASGRSSYSTGKHSCASDIPKISAR